MFESAGLVECLDMFDHPSSKGATFQCLDVLTYVFDSTAYDILTYLGCWPTLSFQVEIWKEEEGVVDLGYMEKVRNFELGIACCR